MADIIVAVLDSINLSSDETISNRSSVVISDAAIEWNDDGYITNYAPSGIIIRDALINEVDASASGIMSGTISIQQSTVCFSEASGVLVGGSITKEYTDNEMITLNASGTIPFDIPSSSIIETSSDILLTDSGMPDDASITIISPVNDVVHRGAEVQFRVLGTDTSTGVSIPGSAFRWYSSIDGIVGEGDDFTKSNMSEGQHEITVSASGYRKKAYSSLTVNRNTPPERPENLRES